jgi:5-formyltetrahydrofolate cyclo-ligase
MADQAWSDSQPEKPTLRRAALAARERAHSRVNPASAVHLLVDYIDRVPAIEVVSGYLPIRSEIDPRPAMDALDAAGYQVAVPVVEGTGRPLRFRRWTPDCALEEGAFGAPIPADGDWVEPELLITPLVAFDCWGHRIGYGGGFYDRTLAKLRAVRRTYAVGFAYHAQRVERVAVEPTDQRLDAVVTEKGVTFPL